MSWISPRSFITKLLTLSSKKRKTIFTETNSVMMIAEEVRGDLPLWLSYWRKSREPNTVSGECWVGYPHSHQWWSLRSLSAIKNISTVIWRDYWVSLLKYLWGTNWELGMEPSVLIDSAELIRLSTNKHQLYILQPELCLCMPTNNFTVLYLQLTKLKSTCNSISSCLLYTTTNIIFSQLLTS